MKKSIIVAYYRIFTLRTLCRVLQIAFGSQKSGHADDVAQLWWGYAGDNGLSDRPVQLHRWKR